MAIKKLELTPKQKLSILEDLTYGIVVNDSYGDAKGDAWEFFFDKLTEGQKDTKQYQKLVDIYEPLFEAFANEMETEVIKVYEEVRKIIEFRPKEILKKLNP